MNTVAEHNLFENCDGELEMISVKASNITVRHNTIISSKGSISLRTGQLNQIVGNYIFGKGKPGALGIRITGRDTIITNNYISATDTGAIIYDGSFDWPIGKCDSVNGGYPSPTNLILAHNTFINNKVSIDAGKTIDGGGNPPKNVRIVNNLFRASSNFLKKSGILTDPVCANNLIFSTTSSTPTMAICSKGSGYNVSDPKLIQDNYGVFRLSAGSSAAIGKASPVWSDFVQVDIENQSRNGKYDIGVDVFSATSTDAIFPPLTPADVGPYTPDRTIAPVRPLVADDPIDKIVDNTGNAGAVVPQNDNNNGGLSSSALGAIIGCGVLGVLAVTVYIVSKKIGRPQGVVVNAAKAPENVVEFPPVNLSGNLTLATQNPMENSL
jgi:poly(beta-D-mannuronate) lyase